MASRSARDRQGGDGLLGLAVRHRPIVRAGVDAAAWAIGVLVATVVRFDLDVDKVDLGAWLGFAVLAALVQTGVGRAFGLYTRRSRFGSFDEVASLAFVTGVAAIVLFGLNVLAPGGSLVPRSALVGGGLAAVVLMGGMRYTWRRWLRRQRDVLLARAAS